MKYLLLVLGLWFAVATNAMAQTSSDDRARELVYGNEKAYSLIKEGDVLQSQEKLNEALAKYRAASEADPKASGPWSSMASIFFSAAKSAKPEQVETYRAQAKGLAQKALQLYSGDPMAMEVLRQLDTPMTQVSMTENQEAARLFNQGENFFQQHDFKNALSKYEAAFAADPQFARAVLYAGDCYFQLGDFEKAEKLYRQALDLEPRNFQGWRFLAHAQMKLTRPLEMVKLSLIKSLEIQPNYMPAWDWYELVHDIEGTKLTKINVTRMAQVKPQKKDKETTYSIELVQQEGKDAKGTKGTKSTKDAIDAKDADSATWLAYALLKANNLSGGKDPITGLVRAEPLTPFKTEVEAWRFALGNVKLRDQVKSPLLKTLVKAEADQQLETAIFLFLYEEAFRSEFEAWKKQNPLALQRFVEHYLVRPSFTDH